jgi:pteridine reductase
MHRRMRAPLDYGQMACIRSLMPTTMSQPRPVALITGAARRLGAAISRYLHAAGYDVFLHYRHSAEDMHVLIADLNAMRANSAIAWAADLAEYDRLPELVARTVGHFGRLDALVNNASAFSPTPLGTITPADWDAQFLINARAPILLAQAAAPHLKAAHGAIVNLTDIYAERPLRDHLVYGMSKAALLAGTRALALELAPEVRVNAIAPGAILWPEDGKTEASKAALLARTPLGRIGTPQEIAEAVRWLLQGATYTTGQVIRVDGGRMLDS